MIDRGQKPFGYRWRSSRILIVSSITVALFSETFLYGFIVPILSYMLENRLDLDPSRTQNFTTALLTIHGFFGLVSAPVIGHFAGKSKTQKTPLLIALAGCLLGTLLIAATYSVWALYLGRIVQGVAGSATWIVGFSLLTNSVSQEHIGKSFGIAMSFVTAGIVAGPMVSGTLLELIGYWPMWSVPLVVIGLDIVARLLMIEPRELYSSDSPDAPVKSPAPSSSSTEVEDPEETTALLSETSQVHKVDSEEAEPKRPSVSNHYWTLLSNPRVLTSLANVLISSALSSGFNNTLPVHLRDVFGWGSLPTGLTFMCIQSPSILLAGPTGWLRDRVGLRIPTTIGWVAMSPLLFCLGIPGDPRFPWASGDGVGKPMFICCLLSFGTVSMLVRGSGPVQLTYVVNDLQAIDPHTFDARSLNLKVFSITEIGFSVGIMLGPLLTGLLIESVGYFYMNVILASVCLAQAPLAFRYFDSKREPKVPEPSV